MQVEIVRSLDEWKGDAVLVKRSDGKHFVVSSVWAYSGFETLVFPANAETKVEPDDWGEVAGGRGVDRAGAIRELEIGYDNPDFEDSVIDVDEVEEIIKELTDGS